MNLEEARKTNSKYYQGKPCPLGHTLGRYTKGNKCIECHRKRTTKWYYSNPDKAYEQRRKWKRDNKEKARQLENTRRKQKEVKDQRADYHLRRTYGINAEVLKALSINGCNICGTFEDLAVDHCHTTGIIRGILCQKHNRGLGQFNDDPEIMINAVKYLQAFQNEVGGVCPVR